MEKEPVNEIREKLYEKFQDSVSFIDTPQFAKNEIRIHINRDKLPEICTFLKQDFDSLMCLTAADYPEKSGIEIVYLLCSTGSGIKIMLKSEVDRLNPEIDSVSSIWKGAVFFEREVFDLFGVVFRNHPDLRRIFLDDDFDGHPLRKDFSSELMLKIPKT